MIHEYETLQIRKIELRDMHLKEVIQQLRDAKAGARSLDVQIALIVGWRKIEPANSSRPSTNLKTLWFPPRSLEQAKVPRYTSNLQDAFDLANLILPSHSGGCSWEQGMGSAKVGVHTKIAEASSPMLALCISTLEVLQSGLISPPSSHQK